MGALILAQQEVETDCVKVITKKVGGLWKLWWKGSTAGIRGLPYLPLGSDLTGLSQGPRPTFMERNGSVSAHFGSLTMG